MADNFRVVLTGGGSGGHIYPLLAVADVLAAKAAELNFNEELIYVGARDAFAPLFAARGIALVSIATGKLRRYAAIENILDLPRILLGFIQAFWKIYWLMPDVIFSKGGPGALPVVIAGWFYRIPVAIHESDAIPGMNNRLSAGFARKIFVSFPQAAEQFGVNKKKVEVTGAPVRGELFEKRTTPELAKEALGFSSSHPLMLILGGSQGSQRINNFILENLPGIIALTQVLHQTGVSNFAEVQQLARAALFDESAKANRYLPVNYFTDDLAMAYTAADIIVGRPGGTVFEIAAFGKPAILIPIAESANDHQRANAYAFAETGAGIVIEEGNLLPGIFLNELKKIVENPDLRKKMGEASVKFFTPGAAETIAEAVMKLGA